MLRNTASRLAALALTLAALAASCRPAPPAAPAADAAAAAPIADAAPAAPIADAEAPAPIADAAAPALPPPARTAAPAPPGPSLLTREGSDAGPVPYLVVEPVPGPPDLPLVIALHGRGDRADRFNGLVEALRLPARGIVAWAPLDFGHRGGKQWFDLAAPDAAAQVGQRVEDLVALADALAREWPDAGRPWLLGFSQGAMLALQAVARHPDRFAGAVALSGDLPVAEGNARAAAPVPLLLTAGARDAMVPAARTRAAAEALTALGHAPEVMDYAGGHGVPPPLRDRVRAWLLARLAPAPAPPGGALPAPAPPGGALPEPSPAGDAKGRPDASPERP